MLTGYTDRITDCTVEEAHRRCVMISRCTTFQLGASLFVLLLLGVW